MSKSAKKPQKRNFEKEYAEIMKINQPVSAPVFHQQWTSPNDFFLKFSLYQDSPGSFTSTETSATINF
jgi:hypothetical protein